MEKIILLGVPVYTSNELKDQLKKTIIKTGSGISKEIMINFVDKNILVPVINEPSKIKQLIMILRRKKPIQFILGVTSESSKKCYIIFSENINSKRILETSLHEIIHLSSSLHPSKFSDINMSIYKKFYSYYYKELFETKTYDEQLFNKFLKNLVYNIEWNGDILFSAFKNYTKLDMSRIEKRMKVISIILEEILKSEEFDWPVSDDDFVLFLLRKTYRKLFGNMDYISAVGQELIYPDEIISILSTINPEHPNVIKSLNLLK